MALPRGVLPAAGLVGVVTAVLVGAVLLTGEDELPGPPIAPAVVVTPTTAPSTAPGTTRPASPTDHEDDDDPTEVPPSVETLDDDA